MLLGTLKRIATVASKSRDLNLFCNGTKINCTQSYKCDLKHEIDKHTILLVRKCLNGTVCSNVKDYFMINDHNVRTRNRNILIQIPKVKLEFAKNGFFFMGARLYNSLPKDIRESADDFENKVNSFFK